MSHLDEFAQCIDWELLSRQKLLLLQMSDTHPALEGLLNLIDAMQDAADSDGLPVAWIDDNTKPAGEG